MVVAIVDKDMLQFDEAVATVDKEMLSNLPLSKGVAVRDWQPLS